MKKIKDLETALNLFEEYALERSAAIDRADHKTANNNFYKIKEIITFLKKSNQLIELKRFFNHSSIGPRMTSAIYLLPICEKESEKTLTEISKRGDIHSFTAEMTLTEWKNGNMKL